MTNNNDLYPGYWRKMVAVAMLIYSVEKPINFHFLLVTESMDTHNLICRKLRGQCSLLLIALINDLLFPFCLTDSCYGGWFFFTRKKFSIS